MLKKLWNDEAGFVVSTELILIATILVIGLITGLVTIRDQVVQELGDTAAAVSDIDQSYSYSGIVAHHSSTAGSLYLDQLDDCDVQTEPAGSEPACIDLNTVAGAGVE